jgi:hypothetical protein
MHQLVRILLEEIPVSVVTIYSPLMQNPRPKTCVDDFCHAPRLTLFGLALPAFADPISNREIGTHHVTVAGAHAIQRIDAARVLSKDALLGLRKPRIQRRN